MTKSRPYRPARVLLGSGWRSTWTLKQWGAKDTIEAGSHNRSVGFRTILAGRVKR